MAKFEIPTEAARPLYAGVGATDLVVGYVRDAVADFQKRFAEVQKDVQTRINDFDLEPNALREAIEARVAELQVEARDFQARLQEFLNENVESVNTTYADLAKRGETLVGRIRTQESTKATASSARTTTAKAKTTKTQAKKTAKKSPAKSSAKATSTAAKKTAANAAKAATDAAEKVGD